MMSKFDTSATGKLNKEETRNLLTSVKREQLGDPTAEVKEELLDKIIGKFDFSGDGNIEKADLIGAVKKYKALLRHSEKMSELFAKFDKDKSGVLSDEQLLALLSELAQERGMPAPDESDVEYVKGISDKDGSGASTRAPWRSHLALTSPVRSHAHRCVRALALRAVAEDELSAAISTWYKHAQEMKEKEGSSACVVL